MERSRSDVETRVESLVAECLERAESDPASVVDAVCAEHENLASAVRARLAELNVLGLVGAGPAAGEAAFPERLGEFRLLRRLGGGGMGVVYLAEQEKLGRRVALKLIRPEHLYFPGARERFRREVEAVARLQHPGIVPIFTVGEEHGIPYFAMERVEGCSLADVIEALAKTPPERLSGEDFARAVAARSHDAPPPNASDSGVRVFGGSWVEVCLRVAGLVAEALEHAHRRGVLHRDVKPSNVMITPDGRVMLVDFGLASAQGASKLTQSGALVGSLPFMAPEQVRGDVAAIDARTDVYALGVTLYEALALRLPFASDSHEDARRRILAGGPEPVRAANAAVPWDAETVCLTAMERDPARRYASAEAFARDVRNVLELRPIEARRAGPWIHARRWAQRHPALGVAIALGTLLVVGGPIAFGLLQRAAREEETRLLGVAETNLDLALDSVDQMLTRVGDVRLADEPRTEALRRELLEDALRFHQRLLAQSSENPKARRATALAHERVAMLQGTLGAAAEAEASFGKALEILDRLRAEQPGDARIRRDLAKTHGDRGVFDFGARRVADAEREWRESLALTEALAAESPGDRPLRVEAAKARQNLGLALRDQGRYGEAEADYVAAYEAFRRLAAERPDDRDAALSHASSALSFGVLLQAKGDLEAAEARMTESLGIRDRVRAAGREPVRDRELRAKELHYLGDVRTRRGKLADAESALRDSTELMRALANEFPDTPVYAVELGATLAELGSLLARRGRVDEAASTLDEAATRLATTPRSLRKVEVVETVRLHRALLAQRTGRLEDADRAFAEIGASLDDAMREFPSETRFRSMAASVANNAGNLRKERGDVSGAARAYVRAAELFESLAAGAPEESEHTRNAAKIRDNLAMLLEAEGDHAAAVDALRPAVDAFDRLPPDVANASAVRRESALVRRDLGYLLARAGSPADAEPLVRSALADHEALRSAFPGESGLAEEIRDDELSLADVLARLGDANDARDCAEKGVAAADGDDESWETVASVYARCVALDAADAGAAEGDRAHALDALRKSIAAGFRDAARLRVGPDYVALRKLPEFEALVASIPAASRPASFPR